jgi:LacI family transcriptional regulator
VARIDGGGAARPVTLEDVARRAGVSQPTASRVLNGSERRVKDAYRERVLQAAQELGYTANVAAQAVARGRSRVIALVISGIADPYFSAMAAAVMHEAELSGLRVTIAVTDRRPDRELDLVRELRGQQPRAIVLAGTGHLRSELNEPLTAELRLFEAAGGSVVLISRRDLPFETVSYNDFDGAKQLGARLATLGYRRPLVLGSGMPLTAMEQRIDGFLAGFHEHGVAVPADLVQHPEFSWEGARQTILELPEATLPELDLVFAITDEMALGAMAGLRARGMRIPEDVGVAGFDDISTLRDVSPALTTVHTPLDEVAREALRRIAASDGTAAGDTDGDGDTDGGGDQARLIPTHPVMRASTPQREVAGPRDLRA